MSGRRFTREGAAKTGAGKHGAHSAVVGKDFVEASTRKAYREATKPSVAVLPAEKPKRSKKEPSRESTAANLVADAAVDAITILASWWPHAPTYALLRHVTIHVIYLEFAASLGMRVPASESALLPFTGAGVVRFLDRIRALPFADLTTEHFGAAHETLSGHDLVDGKIVPTSGRRAGGVHFTPRSLTEPMVMRTLDPLLRALGAELSGPIPKFRSGSRATHDHDPDGPADASAAFLSVATKVPTPEQILALKVCDPSVGAGAFLLTAVRFLGDVLVASWAEHGGAPQTGDVALIARRLIAIRCLYGVDICPFAIVATQLALTLECRADAMPHDWLAGKLKVGDALVGLSRDQMVRFHWHDKDKKDAPIPADRALEKFVDDAMAKGAAARLARMAELAEMATRGAA